VSTGRGSRHALRKAPKREDQQHLVAPIDGVVQQLDVHTMGDVVTPAQPLMMVVPVDAPLEIEATVLNKDKGIVAASQQILEVLEAQRKAAKKLYGMLDDLGWGSVATVRDRFHHWRLDHRRSTRKTINVTAPVLELKSPFLSTQRIIILHSSSEDHVIFFGF